MITTCSNQELTEQQFTGIYRAYYNYLVRFALTKVKERMVAEDIVTDTMIKLWDKRNDFKEKSSIKAFLFISTRNACLNHLRWLWYHKREETIMKKEAEVSEHSILHRILREEAKQNVLTLLERLPKQCRTIIKLLYYYKRSYQEIADLMKISVHTVRNQRTRGLKLMMERYKVISSMEDEPMADPISIVNAELRTILECKENTDIYGLVAKLPEKCSKIIQLSFYKKKSIQEIAAILNIPVSMVIYHKLYGIELLKKRSARKFIT